MRIAHSCTALSVLFLLLAALSSHAQPDARQVPLAELQRALKGHNLWEYARYTSGRGKGTASLACKSPVIVAETLPEVVVTYTAAAGGIAPGGKVSVWFPNGCTPPQTTDKAKPGYVEVLTPNNAPANISTDFTWNFRLHQSFATDAHKMIATAVLPEGLKDGEQLRFIWHKPHVSRFARRWEGDRFWCRVYADHDADGWEEELPDSPWVPRVPLAANRIVARAGSTARVGEPVRLTVMAMDEYDNPAIAYRGTLHFATEDPGAVLPKPRAFTEQDNGCYTFECTFSKPGFHWVTLEDKASGFTVSSNPIEVFVEEPEYRLYWGDLHVHTELSADGINGAHSLTTYPGAYQIGRYRYGLDFMANTDHHGATSYNPEDWESMVAATNDANAPGKFVTLVAAEMSHGKGDQNVYFLGDTAPYLPYGPPDKHPQELWEFLKPMECFAVPHHFAQSMRPWQWENYNENLMVVAEIFSNHGRAEHFQNEPHYSYHPIPTIEGKTWQDQLNKGRQMGCIAASDDHWGRPGYCGVAGVWAKKLTREEIYWNLKRKHCYASTNTRTIIHFSVNGKEMGTTMKSGKAPKLEVLAACPTPIQEAVVIKNGAVVFQGQPDGRTVRFEWQDPKLTENAYYYVRVKMEGEPTAEDNLKDKPEFAWSSPVWVEKRG